MKKAFVDIQNNGWMGTDFSAPGLTAEKVKDITRSLVSRGTAAYCPTVITTRLDIYKQSLQAIARAMKDPEVGPHIPGIHLEGPFISPVPGAVGAHPKESVLDPDPSLLDRFQEWAEGRIVLLTVAPERPGCEALIRHAVQQGIVVSMGHHLASDADMDRAVRAGVRLCTHVGNGLPNEIHRHKNPLWRQLACDEVSCIFITDGFHLPADFIKVALRAKTVDRFIVVSDASSLAGMPPGPYTIFGGLPVTVDGAGRIYSEQSQSLAGSHSTMLECMNYLASLNLLSEDDLWKVGFDNPLRLLGKGPETLERLVYPAVRFQNGRFALEA